MPTPKQAYAASLLDIARRLDSMESETVERALQYLIEMRGRLQILLTSAETFNAFRITELTTSIDRLIIGYEAQLIGLNTRALITAARFGALSVIEPLQAAGVASVGFFQPTPAQLNVLLDFSADLIRGISQDMRRAINTEIRMAALGERSTISAMQAVNEKLGIPTGRKPPTGIAYQGERIIRTEVGRVFNLSNFSQQQVTAKVVPGLLKGWIATGDRRVRLSHIRAHVKYSKEPIPIDQPFIVGGAKLMYPLDPAGPARETIQCRCRSVTVHPSIGVVGGPLDARIGKELKRRERV